MSDYQDDVSYNGLAVALAALVNKLAARVNDGAALDVALAALTVSLGALALDPCPFAGKVTADQVKIVLGNVANIWPASIAMDAAHAKERGVF